MRQVLILGIILACACRAPAPSGQLTFIAVGQGDCAVFQEAGYTIMIDAGPKTERFDAGESIIVPALRKLGVREIDLLILSHPDTDHIGGLPAIAKKIRIGKVVVPGHFRTHPDLAKTLTEARLPETRVEYLKQPLQTSLGNFKLILDAPAWKKEMPDNDGSLFAWIGNGKSSVVFTGDAGIETEASMIRRRSWAAQVAHIGHHGSYTSTSNAWLEHVKPSIALVSCGRDNSYGHPHQPVIDRLRDHKVETLRTDRDGTIRMRATDTGFIRVSP